MNELALIRLGLELLDLTNPREISVCLAKMKVLRLLVERGSI